MDNQTGFEDVGSLNSKTLTDNQGINSPLQANNKWKGNCGSGNQRPWKQLADLNDRIALGLLMDYSIADTLGTTRSVASEHVNGKDW